MYAFAVAASRGGGSLSEKHVQQLFQSMQLADTAETHACSIPGALAATLMPHQRLVRLFFLFSDINCLSPAVCSSRSICHLLSFFFVFLCMLLFYRVSTGWWCARRTRHPTSRWAAFWLTKWFDGFDKCFENGLTACSLALLILLLEEKFFDRSKLISRFLGLQGLGKTVQIIALVLAEPARPPLKLEALESEEELDTKENRRTVKSTTSSKAKTKAKTKAKGTLSSAGSISNFFTLPFPLFFRRGAADEWHRSGR